jgi:O-methyltransferase involved in polyketide biosynthesis
MSLRRGSQAISPTAHYTGHVWTRNSLSHDQLATREGHVMFEAVQPLMLLSRSLGGPTLEGYLLARHRAIDAVLGRAIDAGGVSQVIEVASGMSARGWRFTEHYGSRLTYVEADLAGMAARKRDALARMGSLSEHHWVQEIDALADSGPSSLAALADFLDDGRGLAIVTEGLIGYFGRSQVLEMWQRFAGVLAGFPSGRYVSDLHLGGPQATWYIRAFRLALGAFVRGPVHLHFDDAEEARAALLGAGFASAEVLRADSLGGGRGAGRDAGGRLSRVIDARV